MKSANPSTNPSELLRNIPDAKEFPGLENAWHWQRAGGQFHFVSVVTNDGQHAFQINSRNSYDEGLIRAALKFALQHEKEIIEAPTFAVIRGFKHPGANFNTIIGIGPTIHELNKTEFPDLYPITFRIIPAFENEFSGRETPIEVRLRTAKMINPADLKREAVPLARIRSLNTRTKLRTLGNERKIDSPTTIFPQIKSLENTSDSFVEFENYRGEVAKVTWDKEYNLSAGDKSRSITLDQLKPWIDNFLSGGLRAANAT